MGKEPSFACHSKSVSFTVLYFQYYICECNLKKVKMRSFGGGFHAHSLPDELYISMFVRLRVLNSSYSVRAIQSLSYALGDGAKDGHAGTETYVSRSFSLH